MSVMSLLVTEFQVSLDFTLQNLVEYVVVASVWI
jgi:hypothetical protein